MQYFTISSNLSFIIITNKSVQVKYKDNGGITMKRKLGLLLTILVLATMAACAKVVETTKDDETGVPLPLNVGLTVTEKVEVDGTVEMSAVVTQGKDKVDDADEVVFEVWEEGKKDASEKIKSTNDKDGLYSAETSFGHDGLFHVQVHVSARGLHTMPIKEVTVGNGGHYEEAAEGEHEHGHADGFTMHFTEPKNMKSGEATEFVVHLQIDGKPFEKAQVRYEIWNEATPDKHDWIDGEESVAGEYTASYTFAEAGSHKIQIHVKDDKELHEHEEHAIEVGK
jgi:hypothetical protein